MLFELPAMTAASAADLAHAERVLTQRSIEQIYWERRTWPAENATSKPELDAVLPPETIAAKVYAYLSRERLLAQALSSGETQALSFLLVTGVQSGVEGSLGTNGAGVPRADANPCP